VRVRVLLHRTTLVFVPTEAEGSSTKGLADKIDQLIREGNVRRIVVRDKRGRSVLDVPVTAGLVALFVAPMITTAASAVALAGGWRLEVERTEPTVVDEPPAEPPESPAEPSEKD
jgi:hypothetical protein